MNDDGSIPLQVLSAVTHSGNSLLLQILLIVILTALNAFFASAEIALLSVNDAKLRKLSEKGDKKASSLLKFIENSSKFLSTIQVGVTFSGFLLSYGCPINKKVWSPTFVITTCGLASSFLALLIWIIDIKGYQGWCVFFRSFGVNPLFIYVFAEIMGILLGATGASVFIYEKVLVPVLGNYPGSLAYALLYVLFCWSIVHILYKKGIYVKI